MAQEKDPTTAWLDELFPDAKKQQAQMHEHGLVFAQKYLVFVGPTADPRARELFEHWTRTIRNRRVSGGLEQLAAHNAVREFIEGIHAQIEFAQKNASSLTTRKDDA